MGMLRPRGGRRLLPVLTAGLAIAILGRGVAGARPAAHLSSGCPEGHRIALTFDDGPNPPFTEHILSSLVAARVHATFFDEGEAAAAHPDVVRQEAAAGMAVGAHSWGHARTLPSMSRAAFSADLSRVEAALTSGLGYRPALYRAPYGRVSRTMLVELARAGYTSVGWDVDSGDWARSCYCTTAGLAAATPSAQRRWRRCPPSSMVCAGGDTSWSPCPN
jgi:peptidoglycan/xylan/chitin deacetylase (PgdA/CDA1 family)